MPRTLLTIALASTTACTTSTSETAASLTGDAAYEDASTEHSGSPRAPAKPPAQSARVTIVVKGTGQIPQVDPQCTLDPTGQFEAHYLSTMSVSDGSAYTALFAEGSGLIKTPSGCAIPSLEVGLITDIVVRGELTINQTNCETYCQAHARAEAEAQCGATATSASCRAQAETQASAQCQTSCTTTARAIVAEASLAASLLGELDAQALRAAALGELHANLTFDAMVDGQGNKL